METINELLNILKVSTIISLWAIGIYFLFILLKMASWITAITVLLKMFIIRLFKYLEKKLIYLKSNNIMDYFNKHEHNIYITDNKFYELLDVMKKDSEYIQLNDINEVLKEIKRFKERKHFINS